MKSQTQSIWLTLIYSPKPLTRPATHSIDYFKGRSICGVCRTSKKTKYAFAGKKSFYTTCNGVTVSNTTGAAINLGAIAKSGAMSVVVMATDTRGYTVSVTQTVNVLAYKAPKLSEISLRRTNDIEEEMQLIFKGTISFIKPDTAECNSLLRVRYRYKLTSATSYGSYTNILSSTTKSGTSFNFSNLELCSLDANASYDFHLQICDQPNPRKHISKSMIRSPSGMKRRPQNLNGYKAYAISAANRIGRWRCLSAP